MILIWRSWFSLFLHRVLASVALLAVLSATQLYADAICSDSDVEVIVGEKTADIVFPEIDPIRLRVQRPCASQIPASTRYLPKHLRDLRRKDMLK